LPGNDHRPPMDDYHLEHPSPGRMINPDYVEDLIRRLGALTGTITAFVDHVRAYESIPREALDVFEKEVETTNSIIDTWTKLGVLIDVEEQHG